MLGISDESDDRSLMEGRCEHLQALLRTTDSTRCVELVRANSQPALPQQALMVSVSVQFGR